MDQLVELALAGEEIILAREGDPVVRLIPVNSSTLPNRKGGQWRGRVKIGDDFDILPDDLGAAFGTIPE